MWTQCEAEARVTEARLEAEPRLTPASSRCGNMGGQPELLLQHTGGLELDTKEKYCSKTRVIVAPSQFCETLLLFNIYDARRSGGKKSLNNHLHTYVTC